MEAFITSRKRLTAPDNLTFNPEDMPIDTVLRTMDVAMASRERRFALRGNEPLLYPDIQQVFTSARKRNLVMDVETTGLMPTMARQLLADNRCQVVLRVYRPSFYSEDDMKEMRQNLDWLLKNNCAVVLVCYADDMKADYNFMVDFAKEYQLAQLMFRLPCRTLPQDMKPFIDWYVKTSEEVTQFGMMMRLDCGVMACSMTDEQLGRFTRMGQKFLSCSPHDGVIPDGRTVHCREMTHLPCRPINHFKSEPEVLQYYYEVYMQLQWEFQRCPGCPECLTRRSGNCMGYSMSAKSVNVLKEYEMLKELFKQEEEKNGSGMSDEERRKNLWEFAQVSMILAFYADAIECLEEIRGLEPGDEKVHFFLANAYWEVGRQAEGEEEFRKCARLSKNPVAVLAELHKRLVRNGNSIRARILQGEMDKMMAKQ